MAKTVIFVNGITESVLVMSQISFVHLPISLHALSAYVSSEELGNNVGIAMSRLLAVFYY